jgi:4-amino-4-deoxy-L-arabinose transferase-like glycosyltransferase
LAAAIRAQAVIRCPSDLAGDSALYDRLARSILAGFGYSWEAGAPTAVVTPGYPLFVAAVYAITRAEPAVVYYVQVVVGTVAVALLAAVAKLCVDSRHAWLAGLIAAMYPAFYWLPRRLMSENLALPVALAAACTTALALRRKSHFWAVVTGALLGAGIMARGAGVFLAAVMIAGMLLCRTRNPPFGQRVSLALAAAFACGLLLLPWLVRNAVLFGTPTLSTQSGLTLYSSYWPPLRDGKRTWGNNASTEDPEVQRAYGLRSEGATSAYLSAVTRARLGRSPSYPLRLVPEKLLFLTIPFDWEVIPPEEGQTKSLNLAYLVLLVPAAWGAWQMLKRPPELAWIIWAMPITTLAQAIVFYGSPRFRLMAEPSLVIFAACGILALPRRTASSMDRRLEP